MRLGATTLRALALAVAVLVPMGPASAASSPSARTSASAHASTPAAYDLVRASFNDITEPDGTPITSIMVSGSADVVADVVRRDGGEVRAATARPTQGRAVGLPGFDPASTGPRAVVRVANAGAADELNPGTRNFAFGADFVLDAVSSQPGTMDDGDNLVQRGLYSDSDQYKLQLDGRRPSCRLKGSSGGGPSSVAVTSSVQVDSSHWYRARCVRTGNVLDVVVTRFESDGTSETTLNRASSAAVIDVQMAGATVPLSIGVKLNADGTIHVDSDQFNGLVDNAFLRIR